MRITIFLFLFSFMMSAGLHASPRRTKCLGIKKTAQLLNPGDSVIKAKFLKKLATALNFPKKIKEKEEKRVLAIISKVLEKDSLFLNISNIRKLNDALAKRQQQHFDTLMAFIKALQKKTAVIAPPSASTATSDVADEPADNAFDPDKDLDGLVDKMIPILKEKAEEEKTEEAQQQKLKVVRRLLSHPEGINDAIVLSDSVTETFSIHYKKKTELFGYHPYWMKDHYLDYNFNLLSTLAYYAYELDGKTGNYISVNGWDTATVIDAAQRSGCKVVLAIHDANAKSISAFLKSVSSQRQLTANVIRLLKARHANGANIMFDALGGKNREQFTTFIRAFSKALKTADPSYQLSVNVPALDKEFAFDVNELSPSVDKFIIDFTKKSGMGPIAPLKGGTNSLESGIARYLNKNIPAEKFIACLPYYGAEWNRESDVFVEYPSYTKIRSQYVDYKPVYDNIACAARIDVVADEVDTLEQVWYDDEKTLSKKYDFVLQNELGGIGIWALGYDNDHEALWNVLLDKLVEVDTSNVKLIKVKKQADSTLWQKIEKELSIYKLLLTRPCDVNKDEMKGDDYIGYVTMGFLIILLIVGLYYIYMIRTKGDDWKPRKIVLKVLIVLVVIVMICTFLYFFLNKEFSFIGLTKDGTCNAMPFNTIISIISIGFLLGLLVMRYLILPLIKREDVP